MIKLSRGDRLLHACIIVILFCVAVIAIIPLLSVASKSLSSKTSVEANLVTVFPVKFTMDSWSHMVKNSNLWRAFAISVVATVIGTPLALIWNLLFAYPLSKRDFPLSRILLLGVLVGMIFKPPMVPYFLAVRNMGLYDNPLVLILPQIQVGFNLIILITFLRQFPVELEEAAIIDGAGYFLRLFKVVLPLSKAALATQAMFYSVMLWNQFQHPLMFIQNHRWFPLQILIRTFINDEFTMAVGGLAAVDYNVQTLRCVAIIFAVIPILLLYPFLQKHFAKGTMIGSVKG